ncbi:MAG TPA: hypothetical protein VGF14_00400 [Alphaproteobacteria bacterium]
MIESTKLETLKNKGPAKTDGDAVFFRDSLLDIVVELYQPIFIDDRKELYTELVDNISDIAIENLSPADMYGCVNTPAISDMLQRISSDHTENPELKQTIDKVGLRTFYSNYIDFLTTTKHAILDKTSEDYADVFKHPATGPSLNPDDYKRRNFAGQTDEDIRRMEKYHQDNPGALYAHLWK